MMQQAAPLAIALTASVAALVAWSRWRRDDAFRPVVREAARKMSEAAADQVVREATRRLRPTSLAGAALAWVLLGALGFQGARFASNLTENATEESVSDESMSGVAGLSDVALIEEEGALGERAAASTPQSDPEGWARLQALREEMQRRNIPFGFQRDA